MTTQNQSVAKTDKAISLFDKAKGFLGKDDLKRQIALALPKHLTPDRMLRIAVTAVMGSKKLEECFASPVGQASVAQSLLKASQLGLEVDGRQGHLVPFNNRKLGVMTCQFIPGYQGLIGLAYNHPKVKAIWAEVVFEKDTFIEKKGSERILLHEPYDGTDDPGPIKAAYAVCQMDNGAKTWEVLRQRDIDRIKKSSASAGYPDSIWNIHPEAMWKKSAIRQLAKFIPQSNELQDALNADDETERVSDEERFAAAKPVFGDANLLDQSVGSEPATPTVMPDPNDEAAEAAMGLAPEQPEPKPKKREKAAANAATTQAAVPSHDELSALLSSNDFTYQQLQSVLVELDFIPDAGSYGTLEEIPLASVQKILAAKVGLITQLKSRFPKS